VIKEINRREISNLSDYNKATAGLKEDCLVMTSRGYFVIKKSEK